MASVGLHIPLHAPFYVFIQRVTPFSDGQGMQDLPELKSLRGRVALLEATVSHLQDQLECERKKVSRLEMEMQSKEKVLS